jgi:hypothetical protein
MSERDIVLAELAELDRLGGWHLPRDLNSFRSVSLVKEANIPGPEVSGYLSDLYAAGLVERLLGHTEIFYQINGDGLKTLEEASAARAEEEMVLRVAKWAYDKAKEEMDSIDDRVFFGRWEEDPDSRAEWIEEARKAIRGET